MNADTAVIAVESTEGRFQELFLRLPPLGSREYLNLLGTATMTELPAQILARAYRELALSGNDDAAQATLVRLIASPEYDYLKCVRNMAEKSAMRTQNADEEKEDLIQETMREIICVLPTQRGKYAETAWVAFARQCFIEAWRTINGRNGDKLSKMKRVEHLLDRETGNFVDPLDALATTDHLWPATLRESEIFPWLETFIIRTIDKIVDPNIRLIAWDHFGDDPSPISSGRSRNGKESLIDQTGLNRFQVSRAIGAARARVFTELENQTEKEIDIEKFRHVLLKAKPSRIRDRNDSESKLLAHQMRQIKRLFPAPPEMTKAATLPRNKGN